MFLRRDCLRLCLVNCAVMAATQAALGTPPTFRILAPASHRPVREAPLVFQSPQGHVHQAALERGAEWLAERVVQVERTGDEEPLALIAWWDPTLSDDSRDLVAYTITDTLWAAWALRPFRPELAAHLSRPLQRLHCSSNGFMDQPFHELVTFEWVASDIDPIHGSVIHTAYRVNGAESRDEHAARQLQIRHMRFRAGSEQERHSFVTSFTDAYIYYVFHRYWNGDRDGARSMLLRCLDDESGMPIQYDGELGLLLDAADRQIGRRLREANRRATAYAPFKQALFLFAIRQMGLAGERVPLAVTDRLEQRILEAQNRAGAFRHSVLVNEQGERVGAVPPGGGTGEATAICLLALLAAEATPERTN
jgi:hypothetical protein